MKTLTVSKFTGTKGDKRQNHCLPDQKTDKQRDKAENRGAE